MFTQFERRVSMLGLLFTAAATSVQAQQVATSLEQLRVLVKPGDTVTVTDTSGNEVKGSIVDLSSSSLELLVGGTRRDLAEGELKTISQRRHASLGAGARWGLVAGAGFGAVVGLAQDWDNNDFPAGLGVPLIAAFYGGLGSAIGVGVSALIRSDHVIYAKHGAPSATLTLSPLVTRERKGVALSLRF